MGGEKKLAKRREKGMLNAEERLACLIDEGSFQEVGLLGVLSMFGGVGGGSGKNVGFSS